MGQKREVFLCHASEEKNDVIRPIATALKKDGITYWLDEAEIKVGDSLTEKIGSAIEKTDFVGVVIGDVRAERAQPLKVRISYSYIVRNILL